MYRLMCLAVPMLTLSACGGSSSTPPENNTNSPFDVEQYQSLSSPEVEAVVLKEANALELENQLKNGLRLGVYIDTPEIQDFPRTALPTTVNEGDGSVDFADAVPESGNFSETNTHVQGVNEADIIKYDGEHIYMMAQSEYPWGEPTTAEIRIMATDPINAGLSEVSTIPIETTDWQGTNELYLSENNGVSEQLIKLSSSWYYVDTVEPFAMGLTTMDSWWPVPYDNTITLNAYDVSVPSAPEESATLEIDGLLHDSRKVGNTLYLVTQFAPHIPDIQFYLTSLADAEANEQEISDLGLQDLLPQMRVNGGESQTLLNPEDCLISASSDEFTGYTNIISLIAIDLDNLTVQASRCLNTKVQGIYATNENVYIGASSYEEWGGNHGFTAIHKFALDENLSYRSTGFVKGFLGWRDPAFRMHENGDYLHIVTTTRDDFWSPIHHLSVLLDSDTSDEMLLAAQIPNADQPETIGKPNEDIYAVRFFNNNAYIVTFEIIDPLYVVDLSTPEAPYIAGELEVPGFSTYLHPVGDSHLMGIGQDNGLKISLFDVTDISNPQLVENHTLGALNSYSPAEHNLKALSFLQVDDDTLRFALPTTLFNSMWDWQEHSLHLFEINGLTDTQANLNLRGSIISEVATDSQTWYTTSSNNDRSVLHDEAVYYKHGNHLWSSFWSTPDSATGPQ